MIAFHNFVHKTEISWAERVVKPIFETRNANDSNMHYGLFILR